MQIMYLFYSFVFWLKICCLFVKDFYAKNKIKTAIWFCRSSLCQGLVHCNNNLVVFINICTLCYLYNISTNIFFFLNTLLIIYTKHNWQVENVHTGKNVKAKNRFDDVDLNTAYYGIERNSRLILQTCSPSFFPLTINLIKFQFLKCLST